MSEVGLVAKKDEEDFGAKNPKWASKQTRPKRAL
jgi:hypothetical protein